MKANEDNPSSVQRTESETISELKIVLGAAIYALRSYQYGNASPEFAEEIANTCDAALAKVNGAAEKE